MNHSAESLCSGQDGKPPELSGWLSKKSSKVYGVWNERSVSQAFLTGSLKSV
jgi:hypothetical protein